MLAKKKKIKMFFFIERIVFNILKITNKEKHSFYSTMYLLRPPFFNDRNNWDFYTILS